jgi:predicted Fe-S protein YdhL (DUF1289 family)
MGVRVSGFPSSPLETGLTYMPYSQFICAGCGKSREMIGSKVVYMAGKKTRVCEACKIVRERNRLKEAQHGPNG